MVDFSKVQVGNTISVHCCDHCIGIRNMKIKSPADSRGQSWMCELCGHFGIGSQMNCTVETWNRLQPVAYT